MDNNVKDTALRIALRVGPSRKIGRKEAPKDYIEFLNANSLIVNDRVFSFDHVFKKQITQQQLYDTLMRPLVGKVLKGYNCTALAYGQTGTGKSYSMGLNSENFSEGHVGMVPRCLREIFEHIESYENGETEPDENETLGPLWPSCFNTKSTHPLRKTNVYVSFIEIYNEKVYDLLSNQSDTAIPSRGYKFTGGTRQQIATLQEFYILFERGTKSRHVRPTVMNSASSRSHAIFTIHVHNNKFEARLNVVDLAGSEGVRRTGHQGIAMSEGVHINQGLLSLNKVLYSLNVGHKVIPYRDSVLTSVLQDSLNVKSYLTLLACVSPDLEDQTQSISTMRFAQSAKQLKHDPQLNAILSERQRSNITHKTPHHSIGFKRPLFCSTTQKPSMSLANVGQHHKTICTPGKRKFLGNETNKRNQSEIGLTPNAKEKAKARMTAILPYKIPPRHRDFHEESAESLFDFNEARGSLMDLNMSTSTLLDVPSTGQTSSVGQIPMLREYLMQFEMRMANNMQELFKSFLTTTQARSQPQTQQSNEPTTAVQTIATSSNNAANVVSSSLDADAIVEAVNNDDNMNMTITDMPSDVPNARCQLFSTSSPIFKVPALLPASQQTGDQQKPAQTLSDSVFIGDSVLTQHSYSLRSTSVMSDRNYSLSGLSNLNSSEMDESRKNGPKANHVGTKRRRSLKQLYVARRSVRLAAKWANSKNDASSDAASDAASIASSVATSLTGKASKKNSGRPKSKTVAKIKQEQPVTPTNVRLQRHRKTILELFNKGTTRQLQLLPQIGQKTAYQIVMQRTLIGSFKSLAQVEKLPIWRGNAWARFAEANILT